MSWDLAAARLREEIERPDPGLSGVLLAICLGDRLGTDVVACEAQLDDFAAQVRDLVISERVRDPSLPVVKSAPTPPVPVRNVTSKFALREVKAINTVLFDRAGFRGSVDDYHDPANSFLDRVLERRVGLPILLSAVYAETARRAAIPIVGVGFPGHFLVKHKGVTPPLVIDPFSRGRLLTPHGLQELLDATHSGSLRFRPQMLEAAGKRDVAIRVLRNLRGAYVRQKDMQRAFDTCDCFLSVAPEEPDGWLDRGRLRELRGDLRGAVSDFGEFLARTHSDADRAEVEAKVEAIRSVLSRLN